MLSHKDEEYYLQELDCLAKRRGKTSVPSAEPGRLPRGTASRSEAEGHSATEILATLGDILAQHSVGIKDF